MQRKRFTGEMDARMEAFQASIGFDRRLASADIAGSRAYARALSKAGILTRNELKRIEQGLDSVRSDFEQGRAKVSVRDEDIHMAVERMLFQKIGALAGKLHTGRSRNDQVATDERLFLLAEIPGVRSGLLEVQKALVGKAEKHLDTLLPGYTHLQRAQPISLAHVFLSYFWMLERDKERLADLARRADVLPLGSGALAGNAFGIDRMALARDLGFSRISENSLDAVSDRDPLVEFMAFAALGMVHLSRLAEDLILWSTSEFGFVEVADEFATGSSLMPQKKNPDSLELIRGKSGRVIGNLVGFLATLKGLPSSYNKDLQEDKEPFFDSLDTFNFALGVLAPLLRALKVYPRRMREAVDESLLATDLADYLVRKGMPFRESHALTSEPSHLSVLKRKPLSQWTLKELRKHSMLFRKEVYGVFDVHASLAKRDLPGGTGPRAVRNQLAKAKRLVRAG